VQLALTVPLAGQHRALLCAADISATASSLDLVARLAPGVPVALPGRPLERAGRLLGRGHHARLASALLLVRAGQIRLR
jgi:hypothetical protein